VISHHLMCDNDLMCQCYCGKDLKDSKWDSQFFGEKHYKITKCGCGREVMVKVQFSGSGHDTFNDEKSLETKVDKFRFNKSFF